MQIKFKVRRRVGGPFEFDGEDLHSVEVGAVTMTPATMLQALQVGAIAMQPGGLDAAYRACLYQVAGKGLDHGFRCEHAPALLLIPHMYGREDLRRAAVRDGLNPSELWGWPELRQDDDLFQPDPPRAA